MDPGIYMTSTLDCGTDISVKAPRLTYVIQPVRSTYVRICLSQVVILGRAFIHIHTSKINVVNAHIVHTYTHIRTYVCTYVCTH